MIASAILGTVLWGLPTSVTHVQAREIPEFVMEQARETYQRYIEWKDGEETIIFPIATDIHSHGADMDRVTYPHIGYMVETDRLFGYDFMANLGDFGLNIGTPHNSIQASNDIIYRVKEEMGRFPGVFLYTAGNHDWDGGEERHLSSRYLSDALQKPSLRYAHGNLHIVENTCYGYYDIPEKNVRVFFLNSEGSETLGENYYTFDKPQLDWLVGMLNDTPKDMDIVTMCHYMPHPIGRWVSVKDAVRPTCEILDHLLAAFVNRQKGGELDVEWDFRKAGGRLVGLFCGDTHANIHLCEYGVNYFISQGMGWPGCTELLEGQRQADYNYHFSLCFDIIAIKLKSKEVHTFRVGAGGKDYDYSFKY